MDINNIYFYLLLGVFLYFLFTYILENYLVEQENFDPSLVPVSSIVTLAKVAQKLVNGNGTLTNPGNLQIGKDMQATGALTVTGKTAIGSTTMGDKTLNVTGTVGFSGDTTVGGNTTVGGKLDVTGATTLSNTLGVTGATTLSNTLGVTGATTLSNTLNVTGATTIGGKLDVTGDTTVGKLKVNGGTVVGGELGVTGNTVVIGDATINGNSIHTGNTTIKNNLIICDTLVPTKCVTLSYDSAKEMLTSDKGIKINNSVDSPGLVTDSVVVTGPVPGKVATANPKDNIGIEAHASKKLDYTWIPNGSISLVGNRNDQYDTQFWRGVKLAGPNGTGKIRAIYNDVNTFGGYYN